MPANTDHQPLSWLTECQSLKQKAFSALAKVAKTVGVTKRQVSALQIHGDSVIGTAHSVEVDW